MELSLQPHYQGNLRCSICHDGLTPHTRARCGACGSFFHRGCAADLGSCPTLGCGPRAVVARKPSTSWLQDRLRFLGECLVYSSLSFGFWMILLPAVFAFVAWHVWGGHGT